MKKHIIIYSFVICCLQVIIAQTPPTPYCMPLYSALPCNSPGPSNSPGNGINDFINSFNTTGGIINITNNNSGCNAQPFPAFGGTRNYRFFDCPHYLQTVPGAVINSNFQSGITYSQGNTVFIDWNNDGVYNPANFTGVVPGGERMTSTPGVPPAGVMTPMPPFTIPAVPSGIYRMRVRCAYFTAGPTIQPCINYGFGETEEYNVYVNTVPPGQCTLNISTSTSPQQAYCIGSTFSLIPNITCPLSSGTGTFSPPAPPTCTYNILWQGPNSYTSNVWSPVITATSVLQTGVYTLNISSGTASCLACPLSNTIFISVHPNPVCNITNNGPRCQNTAVTFSNPATAGSTTYSWTGPGGFTSGSNTFTIASAQPSNTGVYNLNISTLYTSAGGTVSCSSSCSSSVTVVPVNQVSTTPTYTLCQGANFVVTTTVGGTPTYSWSGPGGFSATTPTLAFNNITPALNGNYSVTVSFSSSSTTLVCSSTAVSNVSVVATSPVAINLVPNVCQNANATISASAAGAIGWSWTGPNNFTGNTATVTLNNIQPPSQGAYFATATFAIGTVSCTTQNSAVQNVVPVNPVNVIPQISQCEPANIGLQANSAGAATYSWSGPNSYTSNVSNPQLYGLLPNASGVYTVTTSYNNGNLICYNSNTTNVTINPKLNFTLTPYTLGCFNSLLNVNGPAGATSYTWTGSSGFTSNTQNLSIPFVQANQSGIYTLEVMLGPCKTTGSTRVDILDPLKFDKTPTNKTICRGDAVTFTMQSVGGSGNYAYVWNPPLYVGSPTGSVQTGNPLGTTIYNVTGYDIACPNYTINHTFTLTVNQPPQPNLNLEKVSGCQPLCLLYNSKTQSEASTTTYDFGNGISFQADSIRYCIDVPGVYNLKIHSTGNNGCKGTYNYPLPITVYPKPGSSINHTPEYITLSDNQVVFNPTHQAGPIVSTNWIFLGTKESANGQVDSSGIRNPERVFETPGKYPVMLVSTTDKGCVDSVVKFIEVNEDFSVYIPNTFTPNGDGVNDMFMVKGTGMKIENYTMEIFDRWGTMLYSSKDITKGWDGTAKGANLPVGAYVYKVKVIGANGQGKKEYVGHVTLMK